VGSTNTSAAPKYGPRIGLRADDVHAAGQLERAREARVPLQVRVAADDQQVRLRRQLGERADRRRDALALEARADQQEYRRLGRIRRAAHTRSRSARRPGWNTAASTALRMTCSFSSGSRSARGSRRAPFRIADDGREPGAREELLLGVEHVAVVGAGAKRDALERRRVGEPLVEVHGVDAVAGAEHVAARDALVRLHEVRLAAADRLAHAAREARVAPQPAEVERVDDVRLDQREARLGPLARVERDRHAALEQRLERALRRSARRRRTGCSAAG
jgi:hypothetical protein